MKIREVILSGLILIALSSCEELFNDKVGTPIQFGATVEYSGIKTRTAYSGVVDNNNKERIDWVNGDKILIHMESNRGDEDEKEYWIINIKEAGYKSEAQVAAVNDPLVWKTEGAQYKFVGIYPSDCAATYNKNYLGWAGEAIEFTLPNMQDGSMRNAYMAAITGNYSPGTKATLQFYPMVTTLYVILVNDTENPQVVNQIILENQNQWETPMVGHYIVNKSLGPDWEHIWSGASTVRVSVNQTIPANSSRAVPVFIIPKARQASALKASIYLSDKKLTNTLANNTVSTFNPLMKYDISIKLSGEGTPVVDPVTPEIPPIKDLSDAVAQLLAISIKHWVNNQNEINMLLSEFYQDQDDPWNYFNDNVWKKFDALIGRQDFSQVSIDDLIDVFGSEEAVEKLLEFLWQLTYERGDVKIEASPKIQTSLTGKELFYLFPNVTSLYLQIDQNKKDPENPIHIDVEGFPYLKDVTIEYAQSVRFKGCPSLTTATIRNKADNYKGYTKEDCPNLTTVNVW